MTTRNNLTGSQSLRESEILNRWLSFDSMTNQNFAISGVLYSVPLGQYYSPEMIINSGSYTLSASIIQIEKDVHVFEREFDATNFITEIGMENISMIKERVVDSETSLIEVHLINFPILEFDMEIEDLNERNGYRIEIFQSSSFGYDKMPREIVKDKRGNIISDTYLKYFDIETDK